MLFFKTPPHVNEASKRENMQQGGNVKKASIQRETDDKKRSFKLHNELLPHGFANIRPRRDKHSGIYCLTIYL